MMQFRNNVDPIGSAAYEGCGKNRIYGKTGISTHFRRRLSWTTHSTLSHLQLPQGAPSTTSQRTLRARQDTQARAARRFVTLVEPLGSDCEAERFLEGVRPAESFSSGFCVAVVVGLVGS